MKRFQITAAVTAVLCVLSITISTLVIGSMASSLSSQTAADRWSGDGTKTAQLTAFVSPEAALDASIVAHSLPSSIDSELVNASIAAPNENARLFATAYSAEKSVSLSRTGEYGKTLKSGVSATAVACGADYFLFHPLKLLSGYYFSTTDILNDCVVIDNDIAWQLFGSSDVVGQSLKINGRDCYISGVCESGADSAESEFYGDVPRIFVSYSFAQELFGTLHVTSVEVVMPDPVKGFAKNIFEKVLTSDETLTEIVENSARFTDEYLRERLIGMSERGIRTKPVAFPYYENTAIKLIDTAAGVYIFKLAPIIILVLLLACELVLIYVKRRAIFGAVKERVARVLRDRRQNKRRKASQASEHKLEGENTL